MSSKAVCFGECMIELSRSSDGVARVGYGGDTLNTAVYLARLGVPTSYMTAIGTDAWSAGLRADWASEGLDTRHVTTHPNKAPGLYAISTDAAGERSFTYWRERSAARAFFKTPNASVALSAASQAGLFYLSGITLALFTSVEREQISKLCHTVRANNGQVAFDPNFRPRLWRSKKAFQDAIWKIAPALSIVLPSFDDEAAVWGDRGPEETAARWSGLGVAEVVVKNGIAGAFTSAGTVRGPIVTAPVDTTGAGDSFNAGYLATRLSGRSIEAAALVGSNLAATVIQHSGAIISRDSMPRIELGSC
jgi:2-dehydro-3-deoxygluconokinase